MVSNHFTNFLGGAWSRCQYLQFSQTGVGAWDGKQSTLGSQCKPSTPIRTDTTCTPGTPEFTSTQGTQGTQGRPGIQTLGSPGNQAHQARHAHPGAQAQQAQSASRPPGIQVHPTLKATAHRRSNHKRTLTEYFVKSSVSIAILSAVFGMFTFVAASQASRVVALQTCADTKLAG